MKKLVSSLWNWISPMPAPAPLPTIVKRKDLLPGYCQCGKPLHYTNERLRQAVLKMTEMAGGEEWIPVTIHAKPFTSVGNRTFLVQRHYIALHGLDGKYAAEMGFDEIIDATKN